MTYSVGVSDPIVLGLPVFDDLANQQYGDGTTPFCGDYSLEYLVTFDGGSETALPAFMRESLDGTELSISTGDITMRGTYVILF